MDDLTELFNNASLGDSIVYEALDLDIKHIVYCFISKKFDEVGCENPCYHYLDEEQFCSLKNITKTDYIYKMIIKQILTKVPTITNEDKINIHTLIDYYYDLI